MSNLAEVLPKETERVRGVLSCYEEIGPAGAFGAAMIKLSLIIADEAMASSDVAEMLAAYKNLQGIST